MPVPSVAVLTSGGDAPGMNPAIRAFAKLAAARGMHAVGVEDGYEGLLEGRFRPLTRDAGGRIEPEPVVEPLMRMGGTVLGSSRSERFRSKEGRAQAAAHLASVEGLVVIGGNGSLTGAHYLACEQGTRVVGIPASIDNDIGCTASAIGVDTALNTIVDACDRIQDTARAHHRAFIVEVMGRESGYLAMASTIAAGAEIALFREQGRSEAEIVASAAELIERALARSERKSVLILKSEGVRIPCTRLAREVEKSLKGVEVRATVLGHLVRGGNPSYQDRMTAQRLTFAALTALSEGATDEMVAWMAPVAGGTATADPAVRRFPLGEVLAETARLHDGSSEVMKWRVEMMAAVERVLAL